LSEQILGGNAAIKALEMLGRELAGEPNNKAEVNRVLRAGPLHARSQGSVEFRMQNISSFMRCSARHAGA